MRLPLTLAPVALAESEGDADPAVAQQQKIPDLFVIKVKLDAKGDEMRDQAVIIPLNIKVKFKGDGLDTAKLVSDADEAMTSASPQQLVANNFRDEDVPKDVKEQFDYADGQMDSEQVSWRIWTPIGSIGSGGYYGYGYYPYWGNYSRYGNYYWPRYGYYDGYRNYPYYYGYNRNYGGYNYHCYHR